MAFGYIEELGLVIFQRSQISKMTNMAINILLALVLNMQNVQRENQFEERQSHIAFKSLASNDFINYEDLGS